MNRKRKILLLALVALVVLAVAYGFMPRPVPVDAEEARRGPMRVTFVEEGKTRVIDRFDISAPVAGFARRISLDVGDPVKKGQVAAVLEPLRSSVLDPRSRAEAKARVSSAEAALEASLQQAEALRAEAKLAATELSRVKELFDRGFASKEEVDRAEANASSVQARLRSAQFSVEVAKFELEGARTALKYSAVGDGSAGSLPVSIRTPVDGSVLKVLHKSEGVVSAGEALITVGDPNAIEVEVEVLSDAAVQVRPGTRVLFERWGGEKTLEGKVRVVEPAGFTKVSALGVEEQRVLVISDITSPPENWGRLGDGYRVEASFILWEGEDVLQIPDSSLFRYKDGWAAFIMENNRARLRQVELGHRSGLVAEVVSGLKEGDVVIVHPDDTIEDGTRVRLRQ